MNKTKLIIFIGTVGSGKTTQMKLLASKLRKEGLKVKTTSIKTNHLLARFLILILAHIFVKRLKDVYPIRALIEEKPLIFKRVFKLWLALDSFSISLRFLSTVLLPAKMGHIILVEEYIPATISDYIYLSKAVSLPPETSSFAIRFMLKLMHAGNPTQVVFLDAQAGALGLRWRSRGSLDEKPNYLQMQRTTLLSLSKILSSSEIIYIDTTNRNIMETHKLIVSHLAKSSAQ